jgi:hypothetical protein
MKKLIFVCAALALSFGSFAQSDTSKLIIINHDATYQDQIDMSKVDGCMMKEGKMLMIKDSVLSPMTVPMTMKNGTKVMIDGLCVLENGTELRMKEGDHIDMAGVLHIRKDVGIKND